MTASGNGRAAGDAPPGAPARTDVAGADAAGGAEAAAADTDAVETVPLVDAGGDEADPGEADAVEAGGVGADAAATSAAATSAAQADGVGADAAGAAQADLGRDEADAVEAVPLVVTPMRRRHLRQVLRIDHAVYPRPWTLGLYLGELATTTGRSYLVIREGTQVVAYGGIMVIEGDAHVTTIAVAPTHQRQGLATRLLVVLLRDAVALGAHRATLEVRASNKGAQALYSRFGFAPAGVRRGYYVDNREDAVIMWAHDVDGRSYADRLARIEDGLGRPSTLQGVLSA